MSAAADYLTLINRKLALVSPVGIDFQGIAHPAFFPHQNALTAWALRRGRAAVFADTGLGKSWIQLAWAREICRHTGGDVLILAPLAVASQTVAEGKRIGIPVTLCRDGADVRPGVNITNEVLDQSHILDAVLEHCKGARYIAVGQLAQKALHAAGVSGFATVRHPAHGGATLFRNQMQSLGAGRAA